MTSAEFDDLPVFVGPGGGHDDLWREHAACRGLPADPFFEERGGQAREAEEVCAGCPVRLECLQEAVLGPPTFYSHGVWGGTTERHRRVLRRELERSPHRNRFFGPESCGCGFCASLADLADRMAALTRGLDVPAFDGVGGTSRSHGKASTYAAGCRCDRCRDAMREQRRRRRAVLEAAELDDHDDVA